MPGACVLHASAPVFPCHVQTPCGGHVTRHRSSSIHRSSPDELLTLGSQWLTKVDAYAQVGIACGACATLRPHLTPSTMNPEPTLEARNPTPLTLHPLSQTPNPSGASVRSSTRLPTATILLPRLVRACARKCGPVLMVCARSCSACIKRVHGCLAHENTPAPLGPP